MARRFYEFPEEVLEEVFSWLPPESLMRFKCVSKSWYALINSLVKNPVFVNKHLHNIDKKILSSSTCLVFRCLRPAYRPGTNLEILSPLELFSSLTLFHDDGLNDHMHYVSENLDLPIISSLLDMSNGLGCHCNGIIFLADYDENLVLWNPAIKEYRALPEPYHSKYDSLIEGMGFGYDSRTNDYKVVKFGIYLYPLETLEHIKAEVYSLKTDSWREIGFQIQFDDLHVLHKAEFCEGVLYWSLWDDYKHMIVSFDMFDEVFCSIPLPDNLRFPGERHVRLRVWNESVSLFYYPSEIEASFSFEVWVLDDCFGGVKGSYSWIKKLTIGPLDGILYAWTFWKNDELLLEAVGGGQISYNLRTQMLRNLILQGVDSVTCWEFSYVKSLVSVQGGNQAH